VDAIHYIEKSNWQTVLTPKEVIWENGAIIQKNVTETVKNILQKVPVTEYEKEALKTELMQNKFWWWTKDILWVLYNLTKWTIFEWLFNKMWFFDKVLLSKERQAATRELASRPW
jgi:hypothetical protein